MNPGIRTTLAAALVSVLISGCGKSPEEEAGLAQTPEQAASQMESAFSGADPRLQQLATATSEALRKNEYENAVVSLQTMRTTEEVTPDQRIAIYGSALTLESQLISAMQAGDKNAERAYQMLRELKRN